jgi:hypothetical protein
MNNLKASLLTFSAFAGSLVSVSGAITLYSEDFSNTVANQYSYTAPSGGGLAERTTDANGFTAADFSNGTYADMERAGNLITDAIDISAYALSQVVVTFELAAVIGAWDNDDTFSFQLLDAANSDAVLFTLDNLLPGGSNQPLLAYNGAPYAGSETALSIGLTPSFLSYNLSDYVTSESTTSIKVQLLGQGSADADRNALGSITVAVPEPSTFALLAGMGALGFILYRRRQR